VLPDRLAKLAARSAQLREAVVEKRAFVASLAKGIGSLGLKAGKLVGKQAIKNPVGTATTALVGYAGVQGARGKYKQYKAGFDPTVQKAMLGQPPTPPGVDE
jgi:hypothetical protein